MTKLQNLKFKKNKGFTLVEILTVVFLGTLIIMAAYSVYLMSYKSYKKQSESAELTQNARVALERMTREIRQTNEIVTTLPEVGTNPGGSTIQFQDGHDISKIQYLTYYLSGSDLKRRRSHFCLIASCTENEWVPWPTEDATEYFDEDQIKAEKITALEMWNNDVVVLKIVVSDGSTSYQFETKILARNAQ